MFGFRPSAFFDPWGRDYVHFPEELIYSGPYRPARTYGEAFSTEQPCCCPACKPVDELDVYSRPYASSHGQHPSAGYCTHHHHQQQRRPNATHPTDEFAVRCGHPATHAYAKAHAIPGCPSYHINTMLGGPATVHVAEAAPAAPCHAVPGSRPASSHAAMNRAAHTFTQPQEAMPHEAMWEAAFYREPAPLEAPLHRAYLVQQPQRVVAPSPSQSVSSNRGRHIIPVFAACGKPPTEAEQVAVQHKPAAPVAAVPPQQQLRKLSRAEAATIIQSWWRMRRLARQHSALKSLAAAAVQLSSTTQLFQKYKEESSTPTGKQEPSKEQSSVFHGLSHKQYLELNELAMRVLLQLDATSCGVPELRAVRKRLTAAAINLLDQIQASYSAAVNASMELPDAVVLAAVQGMTKATAAPVKAAKLAPAGPADHEDTQEVALPMEAEAAMSAHAPAERYQLPLQQGPPEQEDDEQCQEASLPLPESVQWLQGQHGNLVPAAGEHIVLQQPAAEVQQQQQCQPGDQVFASTTEASLQHTSGHGDDTSHASTPTQQSATEVDRQQQAPHASVDLASCQLLPSGVRLLLVYPGSRADASTQTDL